MYIAIIIRLEFSPICAINFVKISEVQIAGTIKLGSIFDGVGEERRIFATDKVFQPAG
jgi:hypothetical protein